jgi:hypothetical protein
MHKKKKYSRYSTAVGFNFHGPDRAYTKTAMANGDYELLPTAESMRKAIWRGNNCFGDNTSFGYYCSGRIKSEMMEKLLRSSVGKSFSDWYSKYTFGMTGIDRYELDRFLHYKTDGYMFCRHTPEYSIVEDIIIKNK